MATKPRTPEIRRATVSVEYDDGTTIVQYQEATPYRHVDAETESHGLDGATVSIYFSAARGVRTIPEATAEGRRAAAAVLDAAKHLTDWEQRERAARKKRTRTKAQTFLAWLNGGGAVRRGTPPAPIPTTVRRVHKE